MMTVTKELKHIQQTSGSKKIQMKKRILKMKTQARACTKERTRLQKSHEHEGVETDLAHLNVLGKKN